MSDLNLSDEQKAKLKTLNEEHKKQMEELKKQDNITVKESRERMEGLRKDHQAKFQSILTPEQKATIEKSKEERKMKMKEMEGMKGAEVYHIGTQGT